MFEEQSMADSAEDISRPTSDKLADSGITIQMPSGVEEQIGQQTSTLEVAAFSARVEAYQPVVRMFSGVISNTCVKIVRYSAKNILTENESEKLQDAVAIESDDRDVLAFHGARILARRVQNEEALDFAAIIGVGIKQITAVGLAIAEIRKIAHERARANRQVSDPQ